MICQHQELVRVSAAVLLTLFNMNLEISASQKLTKNVYDYRISARMLH